MSTNPVYTKIHDENRPPDLSALRHQPSDFVFAISHLTSDIFNN